MVSFGLALSSEEHGLRDCVVPNEYPAGDASPWTTVKIGMPNEPIEIARHTWVEQDPSFCGEHFTIENACYFTPRSQPRPFAIAVAAVESAAMDVQLQAIPGLPARVNGHGRENRPPLLADVLVSSSVAARLPDGCLA